MMTVVAAAVTARTLFRRVRCLVAMALVPSMALLIPSAAAAFLLLGLMPAVFAMMVMLISPVVMVAVAGCFAVMVHTQETEPFRYSYSVSVAPVSATRQRHSSAWELERRARVGRGD